VKLNAGGSTVDIYDTQAEKLCGIIPSRAKAMTFWAMLVDLYLQMSQFARQAH
jgi:hypothetical protein